jgi:NADH-quinone oxidoreductase subunit J
MTLVFVLLAILTLGGGAAAVMLRNPVHCALALTLAFAGLAFFFLDLDAQFAGFAQILVYVGAVAILVVFALLLTRGARPASDGVFSRARLVGFIVAAAVFALLGWAILSSSSALPYSAAVPQTTVKEIGVALMGRFALPLEIVGLLLTVATIGAVIVAMQEKGGAE